MAVAWVRVHGGVGVWVPGAHTTGMQGEVRGGEVAGFTVTRHPHTPTP